MDGHQDTHFMEMQEECSKNFLEEIILLLVNKSYNKQKFQINLQTVLHNMVLLQIQGKDPGGGNAKGAEKKFSNQVSPFNFFVPMRMPRPTLYQKLVKFRISLVLVGNLTSLPP